MPVSGADTRAQAVGGWRLSVEPDFDFRSAEFESLYARSSATAFQAPIWLDHLHRALAPGLGARSHAIIVREQNGALAAVFPMVVQKAFGIGIIQPADFGVNDYNAVIAPAEVIDRMAADENFLDRLDEALAAGGLLMFRKIRSDGVDPTRLFRKATTSPAENDAYHCELDDDFEHWRRRVLSRKMTKELQRKSRQLRKDFENVRCVLLTEAEEIDKAFNFIREVRRPRFPDDLLLNPVYFAFYRDYAVEAIKAGEASLVVVKIGDGFGAALFGLQGDGTFHATLLGADIEHFGKFSLGIQLLYQFFRMRHEDGDRLIDIGLGNPGYKDHFRAVSTPLSNLTRANSALGAGVGAVYHHAKPFKNRLRKYAAHIR